ncbi:hypothetical protein N305_07360, partial [Manacus vitellinus]
MQILRCPAQLRLLEETLRKSLPPPLPVTGTPGTPLSPLPCHPRHPVQCRSPRSPVSALQEHKDPRDHCTNQLAVFYRDKGALQALLGGTEAVVQARAFQILGLQEGLDEA